MFGGSSRLRCWCSLACLYHYLFLSGKVHGLSFYLHFYRCCGFLLELHSHRSSKQIFLEEEAYFKMVLLFYCTFGEAQQGLLQQHNQEWKPPRAGSTIHLVHGPKAAHSHTLASHFWSSLDSPFHIPIQPTQPFYLSQVFGISRPINTGSF